MRALPLLLAAAAPVGVTGLPASAAPTPITTSARTITQDTLSNPVLRGTAPAGARMTLQVQLGGVWKANQRFVVPASGHYVVRLSYGRGTVATYRHRLVAADGTVSPVVTLNRSVVLAPTVRTVTRTTVATTWRPGCPVHWRDLRSVGMNHWASTAASTAAA